MRDFTVLTQGGGRQISVDPIRPILPIIRSKETAQMLTFDRDLGMKMSMQQSREQPLAPLLHTHSLLRKQTDYQLPFHPWGQVSKVKASS
jgi:hypothetical protein